MNFMITHEDVKKVARASRLSIPEVELEKTRQSIQEVINYVELLNKSSTSHEAVYMRPINITRPDTVNQFSTKDILNQAADVSHDLIVVPSIIKH